MLSPESITNYNRLLDIFSLSEIPNNGARTEIHFGIIQRYLTDESMWCKLKLSEKCYS